MSIDIEAIKASNPLSSTIERLTGAEIVRHKIRCPFHVEDTPSLHIYDDGGWKCFGCGKHGDVLDFVGYYFFGESYSPATHFTEIIDKLGGLGIRPLPPAERLTKPAPTKPKLAISFNQIVTWNETMPDNRRAYWHSRGLSDQTIQEFYLGWDGERYTIPALYRFIPFGVKRRQSDINDGISAKYTQIVNSKVGIFNADTLWEAHDAIVCEGEIDCMLLHQHGLRAVSSTGGAGSWKPEWSKFFTHIKRLWILYDNDAAGIEGARKVQRDIRRARVVTLPTGIKDIGELFEQSADPLGWLRDGLGL